MPILPPLRSLLVVLAASLLAAAPARAQQTSAPQERAPAPASVDGRSRAAADSAPAEVRRAAPRERRVRFRRGEITPEELRGRHETNAFELVQHLRPVWLRLRGASRFGAENPVMVYMDGMRLGGPESLRSIQASAVTRLRYLEPIEAQALYGLDNTSGVILVITQVQEDDGGR